MSTTARKARKRAGEKVLRAPKVPTPVVERSHTWRTRFNAKAGRWECRPSKVGVGRYGIRDLGWQRASKYMTSRGQLRRAVSA